MQKVQLTLIVLVFSLFVIHIHAQHVNIHNPITLPDKSQRSTIIQKIGYTDITIDYHSPGSKGREIWGGLVPFDKVWRAGANENTVCTVTDDVEIEGQKLAAGSYGLHLLPGKDQWTFIFSKNHSSWGSYFYQEQEDALRVTVPVQNTLEFREWLSFDFVTRDRDRASIVLSWADRKAEINVTLDIDEIALRNIRNQLRSDAYWEWFSWCQAADYCAEYQINTEEALEWIDKSINLEENFSNWDVKAKLLTQLGDEAAAKKAIQRAIEVGSDVHLERYGRRLMKEENFTRAEYVFTQALKKDNTYWRAHFNKGNALIGLGKNKAAKKAFKLALKYAPESQKQQIQNSLQAVK
jgi:tetratricopeptide (TPR) repeat protein